MFYFLTDQEIGTKNGQLFPPAFRRDENRCGKQPGKSEMLPEEEEGHSHWGKLKSWRQKKTAPRKPAMLRGQSHRERQKLTIWETAKKQSENILKKSFSRYVEKGYNYARVRTSKI